MTDVLNKVDNMLTDEVLSAFIQAVLVEQAVLMPSILDRSADAAQGVSSIRIGRRGKLSAESKSEDGSYTAKEFEWSEDKLELNKQEGVYVEVSDLGDIQSALANEPAILQASAEALVESLEKKIIAELKKCSDDAPDHQINWATASTIALDDILEARQLLREANVPMNGMDNFIAISPAQEKQMLKMDSFIDASKYGSPDVLLNGEIGKVFGFRVLVSNHVDANEAVIYNREHVAFARQEAINFDSQKFLKEGKTGYRLQTTYGLKVLDDGKRGVLLENA